ncbi:MAG: transketolase [Candidatus Omnitrophica bacterium]|nr:transketolase [Candidatus Omnitrophota bacterium]
MKTLSVQDLEILAKQVRRDIIEMTFAASSGHPGGSLSATEIVTALYFGVMKYDSNNPSWPDRDRLILSKGHASPLLYSVMARAGYFDPKLFPTFRQLGSPLQGHPDRKRLPGVEASTGSLGQGISIGVGQALARRLDNKSYDTYVVMSDGEMNEGQTWEAAAMAAHHGVDHLIVILDDNKFQLDGTTKNICNMEPLTEKWRAFKWHVQEIDGHNFEQILKAIQIAKQVKNQPAMIVANTIKGKGVSFMENNNAFHGVAPTQEEREKALKELE